MDENTQLIHRCRQSKLEVSSYYEEELNCFRARCAYVGNWNNIRNCAARIMVSA